MSKKDIPVFIALMTIGVAFVVYQCQQQQVASLGPSQVVQNFYTEWISYSGEPPTRNPITDRIYQTSGYVTDSLVKQLDETIESFEGGGYDPVLCAQDRPESFSVQPAVVKGETAEVTVREDFYGEIKDVKTELVLQDNSWKIDKIICTPQAETVNLYYYNQQRDQELNEGQVACDPDAVIRVERKIASDNLIENTINLLLQGSLTQEEKEQGFTTEFPNEEFKLLESKLENGMLTLTFTEVPGFTSGGSCRVNILRAQIEKTAKQFPQVEEVMIKPETLFQP